MNDLDDGILLKRYANDGSEEAFAAIVSRHARLVYGVCKRRTNSVELAEDAAQAVFYLLARNASKLTNRASLAGWLYETARRTSNCAVRQEVARTKREQAAAQAVQAKDTTVEWLKPHLDEALARLRASERETIILRFLHGCTLSEVARLQGVSEDAARMRVNRALESLRRELAKAGFVGNALLLADVLPNVSDEVPEGSIGDPGTWLAKPYSDKVSGIASGATKTMIHSTPIVAILFAATIVGGVKLMPGGKPPRTQDPAVTVDGRKLLTEMESSFVGRWRVQITTEMGGKTASQTRDNVRVRFDRPKKRFLIDGVDQAGKTTTWDVDSATGGIRFLESGLPGKTPPYSLPASTEISAGMRKTGYVGTFEGIATTTVVTGSPNRYEIAMTGTKAGEDVEIPNIRFVFTRR